jgi:serine/threonine protein phosphatase 1
MGRTFLQDSKILPNEGIMKKYFAVSDIHSFYPMVNTALNREGFDRTNPDHIVIICGDAFDRGDFSVELFAFMKQLNEENRLVYVRGNHEDLFVELATVDKGKPHSHHISNGTYDTALQLTGYSFASSIRSEDFAGAIRETDLFKRIIPAMKPYYETANYVFVHGWIPSIRERNGSYSYYSTWREARASEWANARWINGIDAAQQALEDKTIICGHWHVSYGHSKYEGKGSEFGEDADFSPYYGPGIIAIDACTARSKKVNVILIED